VRPARQDVTVARSAVGPRPASDIPFVSCNEDVAQDAFVDGSDVAAWNDCVSIVEDIVAARVAELRLTGSAPRQRRRLSRAHRI